ncbi:ferredoxin reductase [Nocardia sp. NPDC059240]|uniref:ferredoxin reductase n=1 Tax=Nocardia sp. NPDC059240 TaxID=3346786 RepID=UPI00367A0F1D
MRWQPAELVATRTESASARTLVLRVDGWPGHRPGQHLDVRLTAPDGYHAERSYSLAAPADGDHIEITVQRVRDGEVSGYLVDVFPVGAFIEVRGPVGGWFVWTPETGGPAVLIAGGSGIVPLAAMLRARRKAANTSPFRLLYSVRTPDDLLYADELAELRRATLASTVDPAGQVCYLENPESDEDIELFVAYTRTAPSPPDALARTAATDSRPPGRLTRTEIARLALPPSPTVTCYVCGPTAFVEFAADALVSAGHAPAMIRTERFGPTGG